MLAPLRSPATLATLSLLAGIATTSVVKAADATYAFNIPEESLADTLRAIGHQTTMNIVFAPETVDDARAPAIRGDLTLDQAITRALSKTKLQARQATANSILIEAVASTNSAAPTEASEPDEVVVTGTHIRGASPTEPVIEVGKEEIERSGYTTVDDLLRSLPQNFSSVSAATSTAINNTPNYAQNATAGTAPDLRGIGASSTLTLVDGRRLAVGYGDGTVDVASIPLIAVERIEVVTDGASAVYGSDAVAGVVNLILKKSFDGIQSGLSYGFATDGGGRERRVSLLAGKSWSNGNVTVTYEHLDQSEVSSTQRDFTSTTPQPDWILPSLTANAYLVSLRQQLTEGLKIFAEGNYYNKNTNFKQTISTVPGLVTINGSPSAQYTATAGLEFNLPHQWDGTLFGTASEQYNHAYDYAYFTPGGPLIPDTNSLYEGANRGGEFNANGPLFDAWAGPVKAALGTGYRRETFESEGLSTGHSSLSNGQRQVRYAFTEISMPLLSASDASGRGELLLNASGRFEHYSDFGSTTVPKIGLAYSPIAGMHVRTSWGKSFRAPTLEQLYNRQALVLDTLADPTAASGKSIVEELTGGNSSLRPESSRSWTAGLDYNHAVGNGKLEVSATYFNIDYTNRLYVFGDTAHALTDPYNAPFVQRNPPITEVEALVNTLGIDSNTTGYPFNPTTVAAIVDSRALNLAGQFIKGVDFSVNWRQDIGIGAINPFLNTAYLRFEQRSVPLAPIQVLSGTAFNPPGFRARGGVTWTYGPLSTTLLANYTGTMTNTYAAGNPPVASWTTFDGTLRYGPAWTGPLADFAVNVSVQNLFDRAPPYVAFDDFTTGLNYDPLNTTPLGRYVRIGVSKKW